MKNIILTGFAGCFKSSAGEIVAKKLNIPFFDTDDLICKSANLTIAEIFSRFGEDCFRNLENEVLLTLPTSNAVISFGGGTLLCPNSEIFRQNSTKIWLFAQPQTVFNRIAHDSARPLFFNKTFEEISGMLEKRTSLYQNFFDTKISTDQKNPHQVAGEILSLNLS